MAGLTLIQDYSSGSDEDREILYDEDKAFLNTETLKPKLPLPESILTWKGVTHHEEIVDDPLEHDGRIRSFKHERGNWATLVYIDYIPSEEMQLWMKEVLDQIAQTGNIFQEFHVSLTRTLVLKFHWIDSFIEAVKSLTGSYQSFVLELGNLEIYSNEEKTRTFIGIKIQSANDSLQRLTGALDKLLDEYQLPSFYEDASYHISFLWFLGDQRKTLEALLPTFTSSFTDFLDDHPEQRSMQVKKLKCKIGNKLYSLKLA
ncbi:hypothetical protein TSAR_000167 [Trichomalopsis sarcophagae]|uniref:U6 snRNA phosphodiesterase n=1 Tax=Trichomalopsis sarcophagae TaxID=543379 RepID=A0A232F1H9_9HYME|nr:hypothetical protein TSAR_000167 [Trichomalopsis sarcophagae]